MSTLTADQLSDLVAKAKLLLKISDDDTEYEADALACFISAGDATSGTVQVTDTTWVGVIDDGASAGTTTLTFADASDDTLTELVANIDGTAGWTATLLGDGDAASTLLLRLAATSCVGQANEQTLKYENAPLLEMLITNTFCGIETYLRRGLLSTSYSELVRLKSGTKELVLEQPDLTQVTLIAFDTEPGLTVTYTGSDEVARVEVTDTAVITTSRTGVTATTTTTLFEDQPTTTLMASTINAVADWTATVKNARSSDYLVRQGVFDCKDRIVTLETWDDWCGEYRTDYDEGILVTGDLATWGQYNGAARGIARVDYVAGFATLPGDVEQALLEAVKNAWDQTAVNVNLESEKIGDYAYKNRADIAVVATAAGSAVAARKLFTKYARFIP
jgi:hypothetical protein